ncbi:hypothetical protein V5O48_018473, partial [Marasmius crinis-equi]
SVSDRNNNHVVKKLTKAHLNSWQPLNDVQFRIYGLSASMITSREPWIGVSVLIVKGHWKGNTGTVRGVEIIWGKVISRIDDVGRTIKHREGLMLQIEMDLVRAQQQPTVKINYLDIVDLQKKSLLNVAHPVKKGDLYDFHPNVSHSVKTPRVLPPEQAQVPGTPQWSPEEIAENARASSAWDPYAPGLGDGAALPYNPWDEEQVSPSAEKEDSPQSPTLAGPSTSLEEPDRSEMAAAAALEASILEAIAEGEAEEPPPPPPHWITHPELVGLSVQATIFTSKTEYLTIVRTPTGDIVPHRRLTRSKTAPITDLDSVRMSLDSIKPSTEKNLMVVIGGAPEHIGKLSRRVSSFYVQEKKPENQRIVVGVISRDCDTGKESLTGEQLELDPRYDLARVYESDEARVQSGTYMRAARNAALERTGRKVEVRT